MPLEVPIVCKGQILRLKIRAELDGNGQIQKDLVNNTIKTRVEVLSKCKALCPNNRCNIDDTECILVEDNGDILTKLDIGEEKPPEDIYGQSGRIEED